MDKNGVLEVNIVVQGREELDVEYIEVETYDHTPQVRIVERYNYLPPRPWYDYYYHYYYTGPYYVAVRPYHYVLYDDWWLGDWYGGIRVRFHTYLGYRPHPYRFYRCYWRRPIVQVHRCWRDDPDPIVVHQLPKPRTEVQYVESRFRKRRFYSRSYLDSPGSQSSTSSTVRHQTVTDYRPEKQYKRRPSQLWRDERTRLPVQQQTRLSESSVKQRPSSVIQSQDRENTFQRSSPRPSTSSYQKQRRVIHQSKPEQTRIQPRESRDFQRAPSPTIERQKQRPSSSRSNQTSSNNDDEERRKRRR